MLFIDIICFNLYVLFYATKIKVYLETIEPVGQRYLSGSHEVAQLSTLFHATEFYTHVQIKVISQGNKKTVKMICTYLYTYIYGYGFAYIST